MCLNTLYKYKSLDGDNFNHVKDMLENKYLYFSRPSQLNDPLDSKIPIEFNPTDQQVSNWSNSNPDFNAKTKADMQMALEGILQNERESMAILSLTPDCFNKRMWNLYANNETGICIGYHVDYDFILNKGSIKCETKDIFNHEIMNQINGGLLVEKVEYNNNYDNKITISNDTDIRNDKNIRDMIIFNLQNKSPIWQYENEYRVLLNDCNVLPHIPIKVHYPDEVLTEIIFGINAQPAKIDEIVKIVKNNYPNFNSFYLMTDSYNRNNKQLQKLF